MDGQSCNFLSSFSLPIHFTHSLMDSLIPRLPLETFFVDGFIPSFSPGPVTLVSSFFVNSDGCSFSQLLAGAMASSLAKPSLLEDSSSKKASFGPGSEKQSGYKQNRPMSLAVALSPLFVVPLGLSPFGLLNSPGFLSLLQEEVEKEAETKTVASATESQAQLPPPQDNNDGGWGGWSFSAFSYLSDLQKSAAVTAEEIYRNVHLSIS